MRTTSDKFPFRKNASKTHEKPYFSGPKRRSRQFPMSFRPFWAHRNSPAIIPAETPYLKAFSWPPPDFAIENPHPGVCPITHCRPAQPAQKLPLTTPSLLISPRRGRFSQPRATPWESGRGARNSAQRANRSEMHERTYLALWADARLKIAPIFPRALPWRSESGRAFGPHGRYFTPHARWARSSTSAAFLRARAAPSPRISRTRSGWASNSRRRSRAAAK